MCADLESLEFQKKINICLTKFKNDKFNQIKLPINFYWQSMGETCSMQASLSVSAFGRDGHIFKNIFF